MAIKRMRVFAGPNGSGKTTIIKSLQGKIAYGVYVNADDIESQLGKSRVLLFNAYQLAISEPIGNELLNGKVVFYLQIFVPQFQFQ